MWIYIVAILGCFIFAGLTDTSFFIWFGLGIAMWKAMGGFE